MKREEAISCIKYELLATVNRKDLTGEAIGEALDMAIEALSAETPTFQQKHQLSEETPTDLISRADAMGTVQDHFNTDGFKGYDDGQKMMDRIKALPSAYTPSGEWIPIEEREPDTADHVLVTARWDDLDYEVFELDYGVTKALANRQGYMHQDYCKNLIEHIIAWQYKPEPYIEDGNNK